MSSNQTEAGASNRAAARFRKARENYQTSMKSFIKAQTVYDLDKLWIEHDKIVEMVSDGFVEEEKRDLRFLLNEHLLNIIVVEEERIWQNSGEKVNENSLCIYLTQDWVYVVGYTRKLGAIDIHFGNANGKPGFTAQIRQSDGKLAWKETYDNQTNDKQGKTLKVDYLSSVFSSASGGNETYRKLLEELFERVKESAEGRMKETVSQVMLVTSHDYSYYWYFRKVLRDCCMKAGFKRIVIASDKSLSASSIFFNLQLDKLNPQPVSILVVVIYGSYVWLYIFGGDMSGDEIDGVQLLAAAECVYPVSKESVKSGYKRALAQLPTQRRDSTRYYVVLNDQNRSDYEMIVDEVFRNGEKLTKSENIQGRQLKDAFARFCRDPIKQKKYIETLTSIPPDDPTFATNSKSFAVGGPTRASENVAPKSSGNVIPSMLKQQAEPETPQVASISTASASGVSSQQVALGSAKLPLKIENLDGKKCRIIALTNWTVKRLKEEFIKSCTGQQISGQPVLQYRARVLNDDSLLSDYEMDPDSTIEASFSKAILAEAVKLPNMPALKISDNPTVPIQLIGNCVALKNGTEAIEVKGIKRGSWLGSRLDFENLSMGEVGLTCKINGYGDNVFVGVKFRKQLTLGTSGAKIHHVDVVEGFCDNCKGRRSLFIPCQHIGSSKDHLFQVQ